MIISFTIPGKVPSKKNSYYIARGRMFPDSKFADWKYTMGYLINLSLKALTPEQRASMPIQSPVELRVQAVCDDRSDLDNMLGTICDLLQDHAVIKNDRQIVSIKATKRKCKPKDAVTVVTIETIDE